MPFRAGSEETDGVMLVGTVGDPAHDGPPSDAHGAALDVGQVIAIVRVAMPAPGEAWLEGIRVDPRVRGMDVATDLQVAELDVGSRAGRPRRALRHECPQRGLAPTWHPGWLRTLGRVPIALVEPDGRGRR